MDFWSSKLKTENELHQSSQPAFHSKPAREKILPQMLLKGGTLILHSKEGHITPSRADLLIEGDRIQAIQDTILPNDSMTVIDCKGQVLSPGFVDTHHHLWQSQQKGIHSNQTLLDYYHSGKRSEQIACNVLWTGNGTKNITTGNLASSHYAPDDIFWGELSGALEAIDAGTTTVVDHAHLNYSPEHSEQSLWLFHCPKC